jgi:hypothetical protein
MLRFALAAGLFLLPASAAFSRDYCQGDICFQKKAKVSCLNPAVWGILHKVTAQVGPVEVTSGCDGKHARRSHHYTGSAVDFRPMRASSRMAVAVLRTLPEVGGIGTYSNGLVHADIAARKFAWHGHGKQRVSYARGLAARQARIALARVASTSAGASYSGTSYDQAR